jgi:hypothetical protein
VRGGFNPIKHILPIFLFGLIATLSSCSDKSKGEKLAIKNCSSCHLFPKPELLPKHIWEGSVLKEMGFLLGKGDIEDFLKDKGETDVYEKSTFKTLFPENPTVDDNEWKLIQEYYLSNAPDSLPLNKEVEMLSDLEDYFEIKEHSTGGVSCVTYLSFDENYKQFYSGTERGEFNLYSKDFIHLDSIKVQSSISQIKRLDKDKFEMLLMGQMKPHNLAYGQLLVKSLSNKSGFDKGIAINLNRPVFYEKADFNKDGFVDYLVSSFGHYMGKLSWFEGSANGTFTEHYLNGLPGSLKTITKDFNNDGFEDFMVLMAQGNEGVYLYNNLQNGQFSQKNFVRLPPVYGASDFVAEDFNNDGFVDFAIACGDNGDYSNTLKPYHGVHIYLNDGKWNFTESGFLPVYGSTGLKVGDFDNDGDKDLAVIAYFPGLIRQPERGFVFFENKGKMKFTGHVSSKTDVGRWLVMDESDINNDKSPDLVLGSCITTLSDLKSVKLNYWEDKKVNYLTLISKKGNYQ